MTTRASGVSVQLARCVRKIYRKVALGRETGDASLIRHRITAAQVRGWLATPVAGHTDGLDPPARSSRRTTGHPFCLFLAKHPRE